MFTSMAIIEMRMFNKFDCIVKLSTGRGGERFAYDGSTQVVPLEKL